MCRHRRLFLVNEHNTPAGTVPVGITGTRNTRERMMADRQPGECTRHTIHGHSVELAACYSDGPTSERLIAIVDGAILRGKHTPISWSNEKRALAKLSVLLKPKATAE